MECRHQWIRSWLLVTVIVLVGGCSSAYYGAMEKVGIHKRDIMADRVESARDSQAAAQEQFKSALEQFSSVVRLEETDLKTAYDRLNGEYQNCLAAAEEVSSRIARVESVSEALFDEWQDELRLYQNQELARSSRQQLEATRENYRQLMTRMRRAEQSMEPVLEIFQDNVLFLKHNLNAQAIGSLQSEFATLETEIDRLIVRMEEAISASDRFVADLRE